MSGLALGEDSFGLPALSGTLTNPYSQAMPPQATIYAVYYDANSNIVGGAYETTGATIQPGASVGFTISDVGTNVVSAQVSVDPCGEFSTGCNLP